MTRQEVLPIRTHALKNGVARIGNAAPGRANLPLADSSGSGLSSASPARTRTSRHQTVYCRVNNLNAARSLDSVSTC